jgi:hypothetical protein
VEQEECGVVCIYVVLTSKANIKTVNRFPLKRTLSIITSRILGLGASLSSLTFDENVTSGQGDICDVIILLILVHISKFQPSISLFLFIH